MPISAGYLLLAATLVLAVAGLSQLGRGSRDRQALATRAAPVATRVPLVNRIDAALRRTERGKRLATTLAAAGLELRPLDFMGAVAALTVAVFMAARGFVSDPFAVMAAGGAVFGARAWVRRKQAQRRDQFVAQLPDLARLLSNATSAGLAIRTAIDKAAGEVDEPATSEMRRMSDELRLGQSLNGALCNLETRMPSREVAVLVSTLAIQHRAGGSLVSALADMAETLENRKELGREVRTLTSGSVFTSYLVGVMGAGSLVMMNLISPGALERMTSTPIGQLALVVAGGLYALGFVLIRRTTRIEV